jgi:tetratricopeptide (TPR) repeat protein
MRNLSLSLLVALLALMACQPGSTSSTASDSMDKAAQIQRLEKKLRSNTQTAELDTATAEQLIASSREFVKTFPKDTLSPMFLFKAAEVARGLGNYNLAINLWGQMEKQYPTHSKAPEALMLKAFTYDTHLKQLDIAARFYKSFLTQYPKHPLAKDVQLLYEVANSGKSPEELIKEFQQQQQQ